MKYLNTKRNMNLSDDYYAIEKIITRKKFGKKRMYLIKWLGYPLKDCSWEPVSNLRSISNMIENFDKNFPHSKDKKQLKQYLHIIKQRENHIIRIKNPFLEKRGFKKRIIKPKNDVIILIDNSEINKENEEKTEEENELEIDAFNSTGIKEEEEETVNLNLNENENKNESNNTNSREKNSIKLIKPIIIW